MAVTAVYTYTCDTCGKVAVVDMSLDTRTDMPEGWERMHPMGAGTDWGEVCSLECARPWIDHRITEEFARRFAPREVPV